MKSFVSFAAVLTATALPALAAADSCKIDDDLCPACDGANVTDTSGSRWSVTCGWSITAEDQQLVYGDSTTKTCVEACDESDDCWAINLANNGSCSLISGDPKGLKKDDEYTALYRLASEPDEPEPTSSGRVQIQSTIYGPGASRPTKVSITSTTRPATSPTSTTSKCDLSKADVCPQCDGSEVDSEEGKAYTVHCDQDLYSNSSYSPQEWMSPAECLEECDKLDWCKGTMYYDDRSCEIARGDDVFPTSKAGYTAFLPVASKTDAAAMPPRQSPASFGSYGNSVPLTVTPKWNKTTTSATAGPTASILPIDPGCDLNALSCPACNGMPFVDKLNGSYTVVCGIEPDCVSTAKFRDGADSQEQCIQSCDQDVTCLAVMYYPESSACHLCQQGWDMDTSNRTSNKLPYVLLAADIDGDDDNTTTSTTTRRSTLYSRPTTTKTLSLPTSRSITDLPRPFDLTTSASAVGPVGPVIATGMPSANPGGPIKNATTSSVIHLTTTSLPATVTNIGSVTCPDIDNEVYIEKKSGNYFAVACDNIFTAAHSRYTTASDFAACAASCTGQCDGIQFGYSTRCGLYTDISVVGSATGWTVAASITHPASVTAKPTAAVSSFGPFKNGTGS